MISADGCTTLPATVHTCAWCSSALHPLFAAPVAVVWRLQGLHQEQAGNNNRWCLFGGVLIATGIPHLEKLRSSWHMFRSAGFKSWCNFQFFSKCVFWLWALSADSLYNSMSSEKSQMKQHQVPLKSLKRNVVQVILGISCQLFSSSSMKTLRHMTVSHLLSRIVSCTTKAKKKSLLVILIETWHAVSKQHILFNSPLLLPWIQNVSPLFYLLHVHLYPSIKTMTFSFLLSRNVKSW